MAANTVDMKHLPDWRTDRRYVDAAARLDALRTVYPDLDAAEAKAMMAATQAQDALDETETLALAGRAKARDVELKKTALEAASGRLADATAKREKAQRDMRLLENGLALICDDVRRETAQELSRIAQALMERLSAAMAEAVCVNEEYRVVRNALYQQFPGAPSDASYATALGMPTTPWDDLRPRVQGQGFINETRYTTWAARMAEWQAGMASAALPHPPRPERVSA